MRADPQWKKALFLKRPFDISLSLLGLAVSWPLWIVIGLLIWLQDRRPVFYKQDRVGKGGRLFQALKFRSMVSDAEKDGIPIQAVEDDPRVTPVGRILRSTAMDELPQLMNILRGDMSFVGPRALRPAEKEVLGGQSVPMTEIPGYRTRLAVRPGLTGLAQIYLPADAPRKHKFRLDGTYIRTMSFWLDFKLMPGSQSCFRPMYRMKARSTLSCVNDQTVAVIITRYRKNFEADIEAGKPVTILPADSFHFGFPLWFFNHEKVDQITDEIFAEWQILDE